MARHASRTYKETFSIFICSLVCERKGHNLQELTRRVQNYLCFDTFISQWRSKRKKDKSFIIYGGVSFMGLMISH